MRVACVYVPFQHEPFQENLKVVDEDFGRLPPVGLLYAAALAEKAGHEVILIDANAARLTLDETIECLEEFKPEVLAFTLSTYAFYTTTSWMKSLKEHFGIPTIAGGINPRLYPEETLAHPGVDYCVLHFATKGMPGLLDALEHGRDPAGLPEVVAPGPDGRPIVGPLDESLDPYDFLPFPARHLLDNSLYNSFISQRKNFTVAVASTGCPFNCTYCAIAPMPRFINPIDRVMEEILECVNRYDIHEIDFFDADFFGNRARGIKLCKRIEKLNLDLEWSCRTRIDVIDEEVLDAAVASKCRQMYVGIETPDVKALAMMHKRVHVDRVHDTLKLMQKKGVRPLGFFMIGVPGETVGSATHTIKYAMHLPLDYAQFSRMIPKPGSGIHRELNEAIGEDLWRKHILGEQKLERLPNIWTSLTEKRIEFLTKLAYFSFYYRPGYIFKAVKRIRSREEFIRSARTALRMLYFMKHHDEKPHDM